MPAIFFSEIESYDKNGFPIPNFSICATHQRMEVKLNVAIDIVDHGTDHERALMITSFDGVNRIRKCGCV